MLGFHAAARDIDIQRFGKSGSHGLKIWGECRLFRHDRAVDIADAKTGFTGDRSRVGQEFHAVCTSVAWIARRKARAAIAKRRRTQDRVDERVRQRIAVREAFEPSIVSHADSTQNERTRCDQTVRVVAETRSHGNAPLR